MPAQQIGTDRTEQSGNTAEDDAAAGKAIVNVRCLINQKVSLARRLSHMTPPMIRHIWYRILQII